MNTNEFLTLSEKIDENATHSLNTKGKDYPPTEDRLSNFKHIGYIVRLLSGDERPDPGDPAVVALVYFLKHLIPIFKYSLGQVVESEPVVGRAGDAINYLKFLVAIGDDRVIRSEYIDGLDL